MTQTLETSLTVFSAGSGDNIDVHTFADPDRHFVIRDRGLGEALWRIASREAPRERVKGSVTSASDVEFLVLDMWRDKETEREIATVIDDGFLDAVNNALKSVVGKTDGLLNEEATIPLEAVQAIADLRRFLANAAAIRRAKRTKADLLFHHRPDV